MLIFLVGYMYCGKTTLGRQLVQTLNETGHKASFVDLDNAIEERYHLTIADCFRRYGESMFRALESTVLRSITDFPQTNTIVATGGGTPCFNDNMQWMLSHGLPVYINVPAETLIIRMQHSRKSRPILAVADENERSEKLTELLSQRQPYYLQSPIVVQGDDINATSVAKLIFDYSAQQSLS